MGILSQWGAALRRWLRIETATRSNHEHRQMKLKSLSFKRVISLITAIETCPTEQRKTVAEEFGITWTTVAGV